MTKTVITAMMIVGLMCTACGHDGPTSPMSPTATSLTARAAASATPTAAGGTPSLMASDHMSSDGEDGKDEIEGVIASVDSTARSMVVKGMTISVPPGTTIRHGHTPMTLADLRAGERVHVKATRTGSAIVASEVIVQDDDVRPEVLRGPVAALAGTCPAVTFTINGTKVSTTADTRFTDGTCAELANGATAVVHGTRQNDGSFAAARVFLEDNDTEGVHVKGAIAGLAGTCPALTFTIGTTKVSTNALTTFRDVTCAQLANGTMVSVTGTAQADGSLTAARVTLRVPDNDDDRDHMEGTLSALAGSCPALTFSVGTLKVSTSAATLFRGGSCDQLANGVRVEVTGISQADGSVNATRVTLDLDDHSH